MPILGNPYNAPVMQAIDMIAADTAERKRQQRAQQHDLQMQHRDMITRTLLQRYDTENQNKQAGLGRKQSALEGMVRNPDYGEAARTSAGQQIMGAAGMPGEFKVRRGLLSPVALELYGPTVKDMDFTPEEAAHLNAQAEQQLGNRQNRADDKAYRDAMLGLSRDQLAQGEREMEMRFAAKGSGSGSGGSGGADDKTYKDIMTFYDTNMKQLEGEQETIDKILNDKNPKKAAERVGLTLEDVTQRRVKITADLENMRMQYNQAVSQMGGFEPFGEQTRQRQGISTDRDEGARIVARLEEQRRRNAGAPSSSPVATPNSATTPAAAVNPALRNMIPEGGPAPWEPDTSGNLKFNNTPIMPPAQAVNSMTGNPYASDAPLAQGAGVYPPAVPKDRYAPQSTPAEKKAPKPVKRRGENNESYERRLKNWRDYQNQYG